MKNRARILNSKITLLGNLSQGRSRYPLRSAGLSEAKREQGGGEVFCSGGSRRARREGGIYYREGSILDQ